MPTDTKKKPWLKQQPMMRKVEIALMPPLLGAIYFFGWRTLAIVIWVAIVGAATEYFMSKKRGDTVSEAVFVTSLLLGLSLPPTIPFWQAGVGAFVAILFGKEVFGGFPRNVFNPAIVGRGFLYVCFPTDMTSQFTPVWKGLPGGLAHWGANKVIEGIDAVSAATPMWARRDFGFETSLLDLVTGNIGRLFTDADGIQRTLTAGSIGEVSAILILLGGGYLLWTKTAQWRLTVATLAGAIVSTAFFRYVLRADAVPPVLWSLCSGAMLYAAFFMVTDPITAPKNKNAQWIYGAFIGTMIVFLRWKAVFAGAVAFAILLGNTLGPSLEMFYKARAKKQKTKATKQGAAA
ncbi:RnfABCDGE type electron transport complex subunit D [Tichowtungia aerotolerans]|uniref:RnfABCDGE type electron transport complex subunit D n=1 Tax=Tichowtungia aerotolerans TaxID=2697043 RepID=A0A6P1M5C2_9BACT|nr:RnfABCDGE type electron transport complex subunit D [Tichowtungia aerotolerans]QHI69989.1 RnfABCDGE type electron transport complex subunit D [Tichowtungia aerotolerans]